MPNFEGNAALQSEESPKKGRSEYHAPRKLRKMRKEVHEPSVVIDESAEFNTPENRMAQLMHEGKSDMLLENQRALIESLEKDVERNPTDAEARAELAEAIKELAHLESLGHQYPVPAKSDTFLKGEAQQQIKDDRKSAESLRKKIAGTEEVGTEFDFAPDSVQSTKDTEEDEIPVEVEVPPLHERMKRAKQVGVEKRQQEADLLAKDRKLSKGLPERMADAKKYGKLKREAREMDIEAYNVTFGKEYLHAPDKVWDMAYQKITELGAAAPDFLKTKDAAMEYVMALARYNRAARQVDYKKAKQAWADFERWDEALGLKREPLIESEIERFPAEKLRNPFEK